MPKKSPFKSTRLSPKRKATASTFTQKYARTILKPLGRAESASAARRALEVVLAGGSVRRDRIRIYGPFLRVEKPKQRDSPPARMFWVRIRDRDQGVVHEVFIEAGDVVDHTIDANANPSFSDEERDDARQLISSDPDLGRLIRRDDVEIEWFSPGAHGRGRVIGARLVRVKRHQAVEQIAEAEVELDKGVLYERREQR
jgi:hypothetical protein